MEKYKVLDIVNKAPFGQDVKLGTKNGQNSQFVTVFGMKDIRIGDNFYVLIDRYGFDFAYICRDNLWLKGVPYIENDYAVDMFAWGVKGVDELSLERWRYKRALKRAVKKLGMTPTRDSASNLRLWMSKMIVR